MLAARIHEWGSDPVLEDVADPVPEEGESLVEIAAAAVGHIDLTVARGRFAHRPELPYVPGVEASARIVSSSSHAAATLVRVRGARVGIERDGTWAERAAVPDEALHPLPDGVDEALAATCFGPSLTAYVAVHEVGGLRPGERVAVTGAAGAVGSLAVQLALEGGAGAVVGIVGRPEKAAAVPERAEVVVAALPEERVDLLVDTVGGPRLAALVAQGVRPGGRAVLVGYTAGTEVSFDLPALMAADVRLLPVNMIRRGPQLAEVGAGLLERFRSGGLSLRVSTFPLRQVADAVELLRSGAVSGRVAVVPGA